MVDVSVIIPARNEAPSLQPLLAALVAQLPDAEIILVNDGSTDATVDICSRHPIRLVNHLYPRGNGAAIKSGARAARGDILVFMDADGQHDDRREHGARRRRRAWRACRHCRY